MGEPTPPIRSYSQLSQFEDCPEQYRLKRIERRDEVPAVWFPAGNAFHTQTQHFDEWAFKWGLDSAVANGYDEPEFFARAFDDELRGLIDKGASRDLSTWRTAGVGPKRPKGDDVAWWMEHGPVMVGDYIKWRLANRDRYEIWVAPDGTPGIEWEGTAELGGVSVTMRADRIFVDKGTGATIVVDLKSGKSTPDSPLQLRIYRMVIERATAEPMWYGAFYMAREARLTAPVVLDSTNEWAIEERFRRVELSIQAGIFPPRPSPSNCRMCGVKPHCQFAED